MNVVTRGRYQHLVHSRDRSPIAVRLYNCEVTRAPYAKNGKTYAELDVGSAAGDVDVLRQVDDRIHRACSPAFTPVMGRRLIVKIPKTLVYEDAAGDTTDAWPIERGAVIDVVLTPGAFGQFGWCLLAQRVKPTRARGGP